MPNVLVRDIPTEIYRYILEAQLDAKIKKNVGQISISKTIVQLLKSQMELDKAKKHATAS